MDLLRLVQPYRIAGSRAAAAWRVVRLISEQSPRSQLLWLEHMRCRPGPVRSGQKIAEPPAVAPKGSASPRSPAFLTLPFLFARVVHWVVVVYRRALIGLTLAAAVIVGTGCGATPLTPAASGAAVARIGAPAPDLSLPLLDGGTEELARERGKVVLLNFWATWCIPCREEMPELQRLADDLRGEQFTLLTIDLQEDSAAIEAFRQDLGLRLPVLLDEDGGVTRSYGVRGLPATFLIDQHGELRQQRLGPLVKSEAETPWSRAWIANQVRTFL